MALSPIIMLIHVDRSLAQADHPYCGRVSSERWLCDGQRLIMMVMIVLIVIDEDDMMMVMTMTILDADDCAYDGHVYDNHTHDDDSHYPELTILSYMRFALSEGAVHHLLQCAQRHEVQR